MNPMMAALNGGRIAQMIAPIKQTMNMVRSAGNPQMMMQQAMAKNPNYQKAMQIVQQNGGDAQKAFYSLAGQMGVDPNEILNALK